MWWLFEGNLLKYSKNSWVNSIQQLGSKVVLKEKQSTLAFAFWSNSNEQMKQLYPEI